VELGLLQPEKETDTEKAKEDIEYIVELAAQSEDTLAGKQDVLDSLEHHISKSSRAGAWT